MVLSRVKKPLSGLQVADLVFFWRRIPKTLKMMCADLYGAQAIVIM